MDISLLVSSIIGLMAIGVSIIIWLKGKSHKALSWEEISSTSLVMQKEEIGKNIKIMFEDKEIKEDVYLVLLKIENNGNVPIESKDFNQGIHISITNGTILFAKVKETNPSNLYPEIDDVGINLGLAVVSPLLLNSKDQIIIKLLIKSHEDKPFKKEDIKVEARISGVSEITKVKNKKPVELYYLMGFAIIMSTLSLIMSYIYSRTGSSLIEKIGSPSTNVAIFSFVCTMYLAYNLGIKTGKITISRKRRKQV